MRTARRHPGSAAVVVLLLGTLVSTSACGRLARGVEYTTATEPRPTAAPTAAGTTPTAPSDGPAPTPSTESPASTAPAASTAAEPTAPTSARTDQPSRSPSATTATDASRVPTPDLSAIDDLIAELDAALDRDATAGAEERSP